MVPTPEELRRAVPSHLTTLPLVYLAKSTISQSEPEKSGVLPHF